VERRKSLVRRKESIPLNPTITAEIEKYKTFHSLLSIIMRITSRPCSGRALVLLSSLGSSMVLSAPSYQPNCTGFEREGEDYEFELDWSPLTARKSLPDACGDAGENPRGKYSAKLAPCIFHFHQVPPEDENPNLSPFRLSTACADDNLVGGKEAGLYVNTVKEYVKMWPDDCVGDFQRCYSIPRDEKTFSDLFAAKAGYSPRVPHICRWTVRPTRRASWTTWKKTVLSATKIRMKTPTFRRTKSGSTTSNWRFSYSFGDACLRWQHSFAFLIVWLWYPTFVSCATRQMRRRKISKQYSMRVRTKSFSHVGVMSKTPSESGTRLINTPKSWNDHDVFTYVGDDATSLNESRPKISSPNKIIHERMDPPAQKRRQGRDGASASSSCFQSTTYSSAAWGSFAPRCLGSTLRFSSTLPTTAKDRDRTERSRHF